MQAIGKFLSYTANSLDITTCANDVIVIRHADGTLHSSPFFVRFGRGHVLRPSDKIVQIEINGEMTEAVMKMGDDGTAFWLEPTVVSNVADIGQLESPVGSPNRSPTSGESPKLKEFALPGSNVESSPAKKGDGSSPRSPNSQKAGTASATGALSSQPPSEQTNTSATTSPSAGLGNSISPHTAAGSPSSTLTAVNTSTNKKVQLSNGPLSNTSAPQKAGSSPGQHLPEPLEQTLADSPLAAAKGMGPSVRSDASFATCIDGTERRDSMTFSPTKDGRLLQRSAAATTTVAEDFHHPTSVDGEVSRHVDVGSYPEGSMPEANLPEGAARLAVAEAKVDGAAAARSDKHNNEIDDDSILSDDVDPADRMAYSELIQSLEASKAVTPLMAANMSAAASFPDLSGSPEPGSATANMRDSSGDDVTSPPSFSKPPLAPSPAHGRQLQSSSTPPMSSLSSMAHHNRVGSVGDLVLSKFASIDNMAEEQPSTSTPPQGHLKGPTNRSRSGSELVGIEKAATVATARPRRASNSPMEQLKEALADGVPPPKQNSVAAAVTDNAAGAMASVAAQVIAAGDPRTPTTPEIEGVTSAVYDSDLDEDSNEDVLEYGSEEEYIDEEKEPLNATLGAAAASAGDGPVVMIPPGALFQRTLTPIAADLKRLNLKEGANLIRYRTTSSLRGSTYIEGRIFLWGPNTKIVVSDVDGTITKSDVLGHILPLVGKDWTHTGICDLYTKCAQNGYQFLYVTARSVSYMAGTRRFLWGIVQDKKRLPLGPIMTAPDRFFAALTTEVSKRSHEFKIACLEGVKKAFPVHAKPFYAGFGNRINDVVAYSATGIPKHKIFIIDHEGVVHVCKVQQSYNNLSHLVHETFPPLRGGSCVRQHPHSFATNNYPGAEASLPAAAIQGVLPGNAPSAKACGGGNASLFGVPGADSTNHDSLGNSIDDPNVDIKLENQTSAASTARPGSPAKEQGHNSGSASPGVTADRPSSAGGNNTNRSTSSQLGSSFNDAVLDSYEDPHQEEQDFNSFNFWRMDPKDYLGPPAPTKKLSGIKDGKEGTGSTAANAKQRPRSPLTHDHILVAPSQAGKEGINASKWASTVGSTKEVPIAKAPVPGESSKGGLRSWIPWPRSHKPVAPPTSAATAADHTAKTSAPPINTSTTPSAVQSGGPSPTSVPTTPSKPKETK